MALADGGAPFRAPWGGNDDVIAEDLVARATLPHEAETRIDARARTLITAIRQRSRIGGIEDLLHEFSLSTAEGVALMMLAEALLRIPDDRTADLFIEDKIGQGDWAHHVLRGESLVAGASVWALALAQRIVGAQDTPGGSLAALVRRIGVPAVRIAVRQAMRVLGSHFVIGETIGDALSRARGEGRRWRYSFDMLGEGARTEADADRHFDAYAQAIEAIGDAAAGSSDVSSAISVKLSALHPRFEAISRPSVLRDAGGRLIELVRRARDKGLALTVDAEEADRLELTLDMFDVALREAKGGALGLAVQAYQKRAPALIDWLAERAAGKRLHVRLVKGAYWDTEIKRAQERGLDDFPVFTRKAMTDLNYMACVEKLLSLRPKLLPQFATHNALTVASIIERAGRVGGYEFQRLHGMGEDLYRAVLEEEDVAVRIYAPVGTHRDLLAYLVRRLLENGANSSFVARVLDPSTSIDDLLIRPEALLRQKPARSRRIALPAHLFMPERMNSCGVEFGHEASLQALMREAAGGAGFVRAMPLMHAAAGSGGVEARRSPIGGAVIGEAQLATREDAEMAMAAASEYAFEWSSAPISSRANILRRAADLIETRRGRFIALLQAEGGKTLDDALAEVREAVDYCRYYAAQAEQLFTPQRMPGPVGKRMSL